MKLKTLLTTAAAVSALAIPAFAQQTTLRMQTHYATEHPTGKMLAQFIEDVDVMSGGEIAIEMFYSSSVVATVETFDAAINGIVDCDATGGAYHYGGGYDAAQELYNAQGMQLIGWAIYGQESFASSKPIAGPEDLVGWKFRSPPGMETEIFEKLGASPIVMDFTEIFTALETGIIDGADASGLANNVGLGLYDIVKHANYPGFHSMPSDHLACNQAVWEGLSEQERRIIETAWQKLSFQIAMLNEKANTEAAAALQADGVTLYDWSTEDKAAFRAAAQEAWADWATRSPEAAALVESHKAYLVQLGLIEG